MNLQRTIKNSSSLLWKIDANDNLSQSGTHLIICFSENTLIKLSHEIHDFYSKVSAPCTLESPLFYFSLYYHPYLNTPYLNIYHSPRHIPSCLACGYYSLPVNHFCLSCDKSQSDIFYYFIILYTYHITIFMIKISSAALTPSLLQEHGHMQPAVRLSVHDPEP